MTGQLNIFGLTKEQLQEICFEESLPQYTAAQISDWMYCKRVCDFELMSNLSIKYRDLLKEKYIIQPSLPVSSSVSSDGTIKYLFPVSGEQFVEAVYIPDGERATVCISTQAGCALGCHFCQTGKAGNALNLTAGEILSQVLYLPEYESLTNVVIMGMGEPLLNWGNVKIALELLTSEQYIDMSWKRITLSTVGIIPALKDFMQNFPCELAISMHTPFHEERKTIMPVENKYPIREVLFQIRPYTVGSSRIISFEYIVFQDFNHSQSHVDELANILEGIPCKINLMSYHPVDDFEMKSPSREAMENFQNALKKKGFTVTIRKSRGLDIEAACGMLSWKKRNSM
jgi:23S rRNA (adenine2503-C2)-methyltransferase